MITRSLRAGQPLGMLVKRFPKLSETFVLEEVLGLERLGLRLRLYTLDDPSDAVMHPAAAQVRAPITRIPDAPWRDDPARFAARHAHWLSTGPQRYAQALRFASERGSAGLADFARAGWLAGQLLDDGVGHLHTHFISSPADVAELVTRLSGLPYSISAHAKDIYLSDEADLARKLRGARFTVTCTDFNCRTLQAMAPDARVHRMHHGVDHGVFHPSRRRAPGEQPLVLSVGRLRAKKGLDTLVRACALLRSRGLPFRCQIVGYGEEQARLAALIAELNVGGQVELLGKLTRETVIERYAEAAVFVQPSRVAADGDRDGIPNVLLEAMAIGVPVVATRVSGIPELVQDGRNGLLVEPDDVVALADAISRLIVTPALGAVLAEAARGTVTEQFDNDRNLQLLLQQLGHAHDHAEHHDQRSAA